jgi:hypothetical protein
MRHIEPSKILEQFGDFPVRLTVEDPISRGPMTVSRANLHALLLIDVENLTVDQQAVGNLYAEMSRLARGCEWEAAKAAAAYRKWQAKMRYLCAEETPEKTTASGKKAAKQGPTEAEVTAFYRTREEYEELATAEKRWETLSGLFTT